MLYQIVLGYRFARPVLVEEGATSRWGRKKKPQSAIGYTVAVGVNADSLMESMGMAQSAGMDAYPSDDNPKTVFQAEAVEVSKNEISMENVKASTNIDAKGVFFVSGASFFFE
jgi:hypothetical protein